MANRYWVGGTASWDGTAGSKWSTTSGGAGGSAVPTAADDVYFDANSGSGTITLSGTRPCRSFNCVDGTGGAFTGTFNNASGAILNIGTSTAGAGNVAIKLSSGMTYTGTGQVNFISTSGTQQTLDFSNKTIGANIVQFTSSGYNYILASDFSGGGISIGGSGTWDTGGYDMNMNSLLFSGTGTRTINLNDSIITIANGPSITTTGITFNAGTSKLICTLASGNFMPSTLVWYDVELAGAGTSGIGQSPLNMGQLSCHDLTITATGADYFVSISSGATCSGTFTVTGFSAAEKTRIGHAVTNTTQQTITAATVVNNGNVVFQGIKGAGAGNWDFSADPTTGDGGGNTDITFFSGAMLYYVGDGADTGLASSWSTTSGGSGGIRIPNIQDTMIFDTNSFSTTRNLNHNINFTGSIDFSGIDENITITFATAASVVSVFGDYINHATRTAYAGSSKTLSIGGVNGSIVDLKGISMPVFLRFEYFAATVDIDVISDIQITETLNGTANIDYNGNNITCTTFGQSSINSSSATLGSGTLNFTANTCNLNNVNATGAHIVSSQTSNTAITLTLGVSNRNLSSITRASTTSTAQFTIATSVTQDVGDLRITSSDAAVIFLVTSTQQININNSLTLFGSAGKLLTVRGATASSAFTFSAGAGKSVFADYISLRDQTATGGALFYAGANSTNVSNVTGWTFTAPPFNKMLLMF